MRQRNLTYKTLLLSSVLSLSFAANASDNHQVEGVWQQVEAPKLQNSAKLDKGVKLDKRELQLSYDVFASQLKLAPSQQSAAHGVQVDLPLPNGKYARFELFESSIMEDGLAQKYPQLKTYWGRQVDNHDNSGRFDLSPQGFHAMFRYQGKEIFIDPQRNNNQRYISYYRSSGESKKFIDRVIGKKPHQHLAKSASQKAIANLDGVERKYRIAVAVTGEYTQFHGGTKEKGLAAVVTAINRVNQVYQTDLAVKLVLVNDNDKLIYTDATSDPYSNNDEDLDKNTANINKEIGADNYDIGHVFVTSGGGVAGFEVVCGQGKGDGLTGSPSPQNDAFHIDYVAHEIGHQFGAEHTFNGCGENRVGSFAFEPGSGTTIMGYAGLCGDTDVQPNADAYFHTKSISQMYAFISQGGGASCATKTNLNNQSPNVNAGSDYVIPANTPFELVGSATDNDTGDQANLEYTWEQTDLGAAENSASDMVDDGSRPLFRSLMPSQSPKRTLPKLADVLANKTTKGEAYATTDRELNFTLTVRDKKGGVGMDSAKLTVKKDAGPFKVTHASGTSWAAGSQQNVSWDVANTNNAPISCNVVDIMLSTDGGQSFAYTLTTNSANDGSESVTLPDVSADNARLKVKCSDNIFFAVSTSDIKLGSGGGGGSSNNPPQAQNDSFEVEQDSAATTVDVLSNDSDPDSGDTISIASISYSGSSEVSHDGSRISYKPAAGFTGTETIGYTVRDSSGATASAQLTVTVTEKSSSGGSGGGTTQPPQGGGSSGGGSLFWLGGLLIALVLKRKR
ncbi:MAG: M12 family metallo-peptidase [Kangiellaceae bacterium]|nr:M12 family metallo-peptidase [Kangiellaceae bacterium]